MRVHHQTYDSTAKATRSQSQTVVEKKRIAKLTLTYFSSLLFFLAISLSFMQQVTSDLKKPRNCNKLLCI